MIRVTPPLPVISSGRAGFLVEINATTARIDWTRPEDDTGIDQIIVSYGAQSQIKLSVKNIGTHLFQFSDSDLGAATDLLHALRKSQHIQLCAIEDVEHSKKAHGFDEIQLPIVTLPEISWTEVSTKATFMGHSFNAPILITGMTGGVAQGTIINERLARCASTHNIPMGVGSQRMALENPEHIGIFRLKHKFPDLFLIGNIGIGQLASNNYLELCQRAVEMIDANALAIHLNVLQELIQVEGDRDFRGLLDKIARVQETLKVPVLVKEVGAGLDCNTAQKLWDRGIKYFDIGGSGGTSWAHIEGLRASNELIQRRGQIFRNWGIPTAKALRDVREALPEAELVATGGIRDGLTVLKATYTGANMAGIGLPLMRAAMTNDDAPTALMSAMIEELKIAMMCSGLAGHAIQR